MYFATPKIYAKLQSSPSAAAPALSLFCQPSVPVNTNILSIDIGSIAKQVSLLSGDATFCKCCGAVFNGHSKLVGDEWACEFCETKNKVCLEEEEIPKDEDFLDYLLSPGVTRALDTSSETIIFVVDISGSMCVTTEVAGSVKLRDDRSPEMLSLFNNGNRNDQYLPGQRRDVTYVSRLQCVQAAIQAQIQTLSDQKPNVKVGLIVFNNEVTVFGDGSKSSVVTGDKLHNFEALLNVGQEFIIERPISKSSSDLMSKLYSLQETGATALGPALAVALGMCQNNPGSKIVLATDGLANTGVGAMDSASHIETAAPFYEQISAFAKSKGLIANVIGIKGDNLNMAIIGKIADSTGGDVDIVDPQKITDTFSTILDNVLIATNVEAKLILHNGFEFPEDEEWKRDVVSSSATRHIGNAYEDMEITAEFRQKSFLEVSKLFVGGAEPMNVEEKEEKEEIVKEESKPAPQIPRNLPFQVQIKYTSLTGQQCLRVITKTREITQDVAEIEDKIDITVVGMHSNVKTANLAQQGRFTEALQHQQAYEGVMLRNARDSARYNTWSTTSRDFAFNVQQQQMQQPQPSPQYSAYATDDATSNQIYRQRNARANKKQWGSDRKY